MRLLRVVLLVVSAAGTAFSAQASLTDYIPPGTRVIIGFSLRGLTDSPLLVNLGAEAQTVKAEFMKGGPLPELDPLKDIDSVLVATTAEGDSPPALMVLRGRFQVERWGAKAARYRGVPYFVDTRHGNQSIALLDDSTAIAGELPEVKAALDRKGKAASDAVQSLAERAAALTERFDFWGIGDMPPGPTVLTGAQGFESLDHFEFGASLREGLNLAGQIHVRAPQDAEKIAELVKMIEAMLKDRQPADSATKVELTSENGSMRLSIAIPEAELKRRIEEQKATWAAAFQEGLRQGAAGQNQRSVPKPPAPKPGATVIKNDHGDAVRVTLPGGHQ
jgi:hypothetical protein